MKVLLHTTGRNESILSSGQVFCPFTLMDGVQQNGSRKIRSAVAEMLHRVRDCSCTAEPTLDVIESSL